MLSNSFSDLPATFAFFQLLSCTTGLFRTIASSGNVLENICASQLVHKRTVHTNVKGARSRGHDGTIGDIWRFGDLTVVWEPAFPLANKEDCDELFALRSCRHVALPFYKGPTICLLREGEGVWVISEKISCRLISNEKKSEKFTWGNVPALKKNMYMLKILKRLYVGEKILSPEVWEKKFLSKPNHPTPLSHPIKSQIVGAKGSNLSVLVPRTLSHQKPRADLGHDQKIPYHPLTCRSKMFVLRRA